MAGGLASLQMYARPETQGANDRLWSLIRQDYGAGDEQLSTCDPIEDAWHAPDLLLAQTCGLPFRYLLKDRVTLVGTPDYGVEGCAPGYYRSCLIARRDDPRSDLAAFRSTPFAVNSLLSQSGWVAVENHLTEIQAGFSFYDNRLETGGHAASAHAVAQGRAGLASVDAVTWAFLQRYEAWTGDLRVLTMTRPTPGLPLITRSDIDPAPLFAAITTAITRLSAPERRVLMLRGLVAIPKERYLAEPIPHPLNATSPC